MILADSDERVPGDADAAGDRDGEGQAAAEGWVSGQAGGERRADSQNLTIPSCGTLCLGVLAELLKLCRL
jgi:hypothetical protein